MKLKLHLEDKWNAVLNSARTTISKDEVNSIPSERFKKQILLSEHSPIRKIRAEWKWNNLLSWVSVHFVRHKVGIEHFVSTQRSDRTGVSRDSLPQDSLVNHEAEANAQALITISRKRLCTNASLKTRMAWTEVKNKIEKIDPVLSSVMVAECFYRGFCPEFHNCGLTETPNFQKKLNEYRSVK